jgi:hypothetical protein
MMMPPHNDIRKRLLFYKKRTEWIDLEMSSFSDDNYEGRRNPESVLVAAQYFGLDLSNAYQRLLLFYNLADVIFGREHSGRPCGNKNWDSKKLLRLGKAYDVIKRRNPGYKDRKIAQIIHSQHKGFQSAEMIRQRLPKAREEFAGSLRRTDPNYWWPGVPRRKDPYRFGL